MFEQKSVGRHSNKPSRDDLLQLSEVLTIEQIAELYHVCTATVFNWKKIYRIPPKVGRPTKRPSAKKLDRLCAQYTYKQIAEKLGVPEGTVASWVYHYRHRSRTKEKR